MVLLLFFFGNGYAQAIKNDAVSANGQLQVKGLKLCNQYGNPIQLRGMSTHGIQWYGQCVTDASLDALANDWDADILRISLYVQEGGYETDPVGFTAKVAKMINMATDRGMYALVDWHQLTPGDPNYNTENAKTFFTDIATQFKDYNNIIYDICNEPNGVPWANVKRYAETMIPFIRKIDADAPILIGTHGWGSLGGDMTGTKEIVNNPVNFSNIMYTFHFYAASHGHYYERFDWASDRLPLFISEFGTQTFSGDGPNDFDTSKKYLDLFRRKKISWINWNYSDDSRSGAVWNAGTCTSGNWTDANLKEAGKWIKKRILLPADDFPTQTNNIALGKTVTASSIETANFPANFAVDGKNTTRWSSRYSDPQWISIDLGAIANINRVVLNWEVAYGKAYRIEVSNDGTTWRSIYSTSNGDGRVDDLSVYGTGRYIRMHGAARGTAYGYSLYEFEVYGAFARGTLNSKSLSAIDVKAYPNPFTNTINYAFNLAERTHVTMKLFSLQGTEVDVIIDKTLPAGNHNLKYDGTSLNSGMYMYRMQLDKGKTMYNYLIK
ncbi:endoglucanase [Aquimarina sp. MAR_2010_214]|nr:endoglucanase [Aquimarina sp. MAR_2010_214]